MKYIKYFEATTFKFNHLKIKQEIVKLNTLFEPIGIFFKYVKVKHDSIIRCEVTFDCFFMPILMSISEYIYPGLHNLFFVNGNNERVSKVTFKIKDINIIDTIINNLIIYLNTLTDIDVYTKVNPSHKTRNKRFKDKILIKVLIGYCKYVLEHHKPDENTIYNLMSKGISERTDCFQIFNKIKENDINLWNKLNINDNITSATQMGDMGF